MRHWRGGFERSVQAGCGSRRAPCARRHRSKYRPLRGLHPPKVDPLWRQWDHADLRSMSNHCSEIPMHEWLTAGDWGPSAIGPAKKMAPLTEFFDRAGCDPDLTRPDLRPLLGFVPGGLRESWFRTRSPRSPIKSASGYNSCATNTYSERDEIVSAGAGLAEPSSTSWLDTMLSTGGTQRCAVGPPPCEPEPRPRSAASRAGIADGSGIPKAD